MESNLFKYIWRVTRLQQIWILCIVLLSMPTYFLALDLPRRIVNGPIQGNGFEDESAPATFLKIEFSLPEFLDASGQSYVLFGGFGLDRLGMLWALSFTFLALVCVNGLFKFYINTYKGRLGERMLRRLRYELVDRVLRFPLTQFRRVKPSEVATMVKDEVDPLGGFIGDAFVNPVFLGGQAITAMAFILIQSPWLGLIAGGIVLIQAVLIPRLRRRLIELGRQRQLTTRAFAGRVGEMVDGMALIHTSDTSNYERADIAQRLGRIFFIRYELFQRKFFVKFLNNLLAQMTPFLFYSVGGYFALTGRLDIGQLVAVIAAYKDLPSPIKELIDWDQQRLDVQVKYTQVIDQFTVDDMVDEQLQEISRDAPPPLKEGFRFSGVNATDDAGSKLIQRLNLSLEPNQRIALVGGVNSGAESVADSIVRILPPSSGNILLDNNDLDFLPQSFTGRRVGYVPSDGPLFQGSIKENVIYGLRNAPFRPPEYDTAGAKQRRIEEFEARASANMLEDVNADWLNYEGAGLSGPEELLQKIRQVFSMLDIETDILNYGLRGLIDPEDRPELTERILAARLALKEVLQSDEYAGLVEFIDPETYASQRTIAENLLFGSPVGEEFDSDNIAGHPYLRKLLEEEGLLDDLYRMGLEIADTAVELFADLTPDNPFFEQLSFMSADDLPEYQALLSRLQGSDIGDAAAEDLTMLLKLPFEYIEPRHRMGLLDNEMAAKLLKARRAFKENLPENLMASIEFFDPETYNRAASMEENILAGRISYGVAGGPETISKLIQETLESHQLNDAVFDVGLDFNVGAGGKRLPQGQRQKILLARAMLKRPDILVVNRSLTALDRVTQDKIVNTIVEDSKANQYGLIWVLSVPSLGESFDRIIVMKDGTLAEEGDYRELLEREGVYAKLVA